MNSSEIERFRRYLEVHREVALRSLHRLREETLTGDPGYSEGSEMCATGVKELRLQHSDERRRLLLLIEAALVRMQEGSYGICAACGKEISARRLDALPWTSYCLRCQQARERRAEMMPADRAVRIPKAG
ncbi:MAG TPA: TraR/DksA family transcriptional regulator [Terriglobales bacterium]|nr:TraR/DksA family transcriptional regulator [Terriglobales bacterium]